MPTTNFGLALIIVVFFVWEKNVEAQTISKRIGRKIKRFFMGRNLF
jgi:hypothetical protein